MAASVAGFPEVLQPAMVDVVVGVPALGLQVGGNDGLFRGGPTVGDFNVTLALKSPLVLPELGMVVVWIGEQLTGTD